MTLDDRNGGHKISKIRYMVILLGALLPPPAFAEVQVSIGIGMPHASIGFSVSSYPRLVAVPDYPVYYAPSLQSNFFFYDGMYWVYQDDDWYASYWYNGPWWVIGQEVVPVFILRIPVRYYRHPPSYFHGWRSDAPPRWGDHWGHDWEQHRSGWDHWDRNSAPAPAPLPVYQRQYSGERYPQQVEKQYELHQQNYRYQPRDPVVKQHYEEQGRTRQERKAAPEGRDSRQQDMQRSTPSPRSEPVAPRSESPQQRGAEVQRSTPSVPQQGRPQVQDQRPPSQPMATQREQQVPQSQGQRQGQQGNDARDGSGQRRGQEQERGGWDPHR